MNIRTLIVDDSALILESFERYLLTEPSIKLIGRAASGREALTKIDELRPDLVFVDVAMPDVDGFEVTRRAKQLSRPPFVIIVSQDGNGEYNALAKDAGADGFSTKEDLPQTVRRIVERCTAMYHPGRHKPGEGHA